MTRLTRRQACLCIAGALLATGCKDETTGPEPIRYGRETCELCGMIISEAMYAVEIRDPDRKLHKFDDLGDAFYWLEKQPWKDEPTVEFFAMDSDDGKTWLAARSARYADGFVTPMNWGYAAVGKDRAGTIDFAGVRAKLAAAAAIRFCDPATTGEAG